MWQQFRLTVGLALVLIIAPVGAVSARPEAVEVNFDYVVQKAQERAQKPFRSPRVDVPDVLRDLTYDNYREIEFRHDHALWAAEDLPFRLEFFHLGYYYQEPVHLHEFTATHTQPIPYSQEFFNYRQLKFQKQIPPDTGYAGFRVLCHLNDTNKWDELGSFLGASYFRLLGKDLRYGASARGLAIDSGGTDRPEEFPIFTDWWLGKPLPNEQTLRLYAILDSVSCAGAYSFLIKPGTDTVCEIEGTIFMRQDADVKPVNPNRKPIATIGLAPITSMFWFGKNSERKFDDYRPEVHDSDGLLMKMTNGEVLWRPLNDASVMRHQVFASKGVAGFGLLQRERNFSAYQDIFNDYHRVPTVWVEPRGDWGEGAIHLVELSTWYEGLDNIVAFWSPKDVPAPMQPYHFAYNLHWTHEIDPQVETNLALVVATRIGKDDRNDKRRLVCIDFSGPSLKDLHDTNLPQSIPSCSDNAVISENQVFFNPAINSVRVILKFEPKPGNQNPVDLRCTLKQGEEVLSETWTYHWSPP
jgi:glucans biosynthesis protein